MRPTTSIVLAIVGLGSLSLAVPLTIARAQEPAVATSPGQSAPLAGPRRVAGQDQGVAQGYPGDGRMIAPMPAQQMRMGGGQATMVADGDSLYILQGNRLFKVNKGDLRVTREGMLPMNPPMERRADGVTAPAPGGRGGGEKE